MDFTRRQLIVMLGALGGATVTEFSFAELLRAQDDVLARFRRHLDPRQASALGARYLAAFPDEGELSKLLQQIAGNARPSDQVRSFLTERVANDFAADDVWEVDGWMISRTEGRILAALHLRS